MECSRICVKNLPRHLQEARFREHFAGVGHVTDARIIRTKDGKSRQMGFIGYKTADEAQAAVRYFHHSYLDTSRLEVELAYRAGDASLPRPWSRYSEGSSAKQHALATGGEGPGKKGAADKAGKGGKSRGEEVDDAFKEFLAVVAPRRSAKVWGNDTTDTAAVAATASGKGAKDCEGGKEVGGAAVFEDGGRDGGGSEGEEEYEDLEVREAFPGDAARDAVVTDARVSDLDYLKSRVRKNFDDEDEEEEEEEEEEEDGGRGSSDDGDGGGGSEEDVEGEEMMSEDGEAGGSESIEEEGEEGEGDEEEEEGGKHVSKGKKEKKGEGKEGKGKAVQTNGTVGEGSLASKLRKVLGEEESEPVDAAQRDVADEEAEAAVRGGGGDGAGAAEEEEEDPLESGRLFVRNLPYTADEEELAAAFSPFGELSSVHVLTDRVTKQSKGLAYVAYLLPENARQALDQMDRSVFQGRILHVLPAQRAPEKPAAITEGKAGKGAGSSAYKADKEARDKAREVSGAASRSWNTLFMRADTVADAVAQLYGVSKAELLDPSASDVAVRLALGETHVIMETKRQLAEAGVSVAALERAADAAGSGASGKPASSSQKPSGQPTSNPPKGPIKRSNQVILVKNIPYDTSEEEVVRLFHKFGALGRVVLPGTKTIALVEFVDAADARKAFSATVFKRFKHVPLYLEWAPEDIFTGPPPAIATVSAAGASAEELDAKEAAGSGSKKNSKAAGAGPVAGKRPAVTSADVLLAPADGGVTDDGASEEERTLFVKNLSFSTTSEGLRKHFVAGVGEGAVRAAVVKTKPGKKEGSTLSMGFGFVELASHAAAKAALSKLQGSLLDGHALKLDFSQSHGKAGAANPSGRKAGVGAAGGKGAKSATKFIIRNIPFQADKKEVRQLFSTFGQLKSLRIPNKFDGSHRGFGFVEFLTQKEASNAFEAIRSTHLYGRHLVLEPANEGETLEELRARTKTQFDDAEAGGKRKKQKLGSAEVFEDPNFAFSQFEN